MHRGETSAPFEGIIFGKDVAVRGILYWFLEEPCVLAIKVHVTASNIARSYRE